MSLFYNFIISYFFEFVNSLLIFYGENSQFKGGDTVTLASNITVTRKAKNISQEELAEMVDVNQTFISQVERGVRVPTVAMLEQIADVLDCSVDGLLGRTTKTERNDSND